MTISYFEINFNEQGLNLFSRTASKGDSISLAYLLDQNGKNKMGDVVYGYALGGKHDLLKQLLAKFPELTVQAARGYARTGNLEMINSLPQAQAIDEGLARGYAEAGNIARIRELLNKPGGVRLLPEIIKGLATTNQYQILTDLILNTNLYPVALKEAAKAGQTALIKQLFQDMGVDLQSLSAGEKKLSANTKRFLAYVLEGYTEGGHCQEALEIMSMGINPMFCLNQLFMEESIRPFDAQFLLSSCTDLDLFIKLKSLFVEQFGLDENILTKIPDFKPNHSSVGIDEKLKEQIQANQSSSNAQNY